MLRSNGHDSLEDVPKSPSMVHDSWLRLSIIGSTACITAGIALFYLNVGHDGLPIGWDTPHYIGGAIVYSSRGLSALLSLQGPYDFVYEALEGSLMWIGVPGTELEIFLPAILASSIPFLMSKLVLDHLGTRNALYVALATPGWYAVYRLQSDLHGNLFALTLMLSALILISRARSLKEPRNLIGLLIVGISSFVHVESTVFLASVFLVSSLTKLRPYSLKVALGAAFATVPAGAFYLLHLLQLLTFSGGSLGFTSPQSVQTWATILGTLVPLAIFGLVSPFVKPRSWIGSFATVWGFASVLLGLAQYVTPQAIIFSQRAIILIPVPLLAGIGAARLETAISKLKTLRVPQRYLRIGAITAIFIILALSWPIAWLSCVPNEKIYLTSTEYQQLEWVSSNLKFSNTPIFMFNDVNEFAGGLAELYNNWVSALVGPHLAYVGLVDYLAQVQETPFPNNVDRTISASFMQGMLTAGVTNRTTLLQHPIIIMSNFYRPFPLPNYTQPLFEQVGPGIFQGNTTAIRSLSNVTLPLYITFSAHSGPWYGVQRSWAKSTNAFEVYDDSVPMQIESTFLLGTQSSGIFTIGLRYWNGQANNLSIAIDGNTIGTIVYNNSKTPILRNFYGISLSQGVHALSIEVSDSPSLLSGGLAYASLDYVVVTRS